MNTKEKLIELAKKRHELEFKITNRAIELIPILKDHNLLNVAKPLEELVFELDVIGQKFEELVDSNPEEVIKILLSL